MNHSISTLQLTTQTSFTRSALSEQGPHAGRLFQADVTLPSPPEFSLFSESRLFVRASMDANPGFRYDDKQPQAAQSATSAA